MTKIELIKNSVISANKKYLQNVLKNIPLENHKQIEDLFQKHMSEIAHFIQNNFMKNWVLTEKFIRDLHSLLYPPGYKETQKTLSWDGVIITMIPWVYKSLNNFNRVSPKDVKQEMKILVNEYNKWSKNIDSICHFLVQFLKIHPFWNGNKRTISILIDSMLINTGISPISFSLKQEKNKDIEKALIQSIEKNDFHIIKPLIF